LKNIKISIFTGLFLLVSCGGGGGGGTPTELTWTAFEEFTLSENTAGSWQVPASSNKSFDINYSISGGADSSAFSLIGSRLSLSGLKNYESLMIQIQMVSMRLHCLHQLKELQQQNQFM